MRDFTENLKPAVPTGPDTLAKERSQSSLPVDDLSAHLFPDGFLERQERICKELQKHKVFSKQNQMDLARPDRYKVGLARAKMTRRIAEKLNWDDEDHQMAEYLIDEMSPYALQTAMFIVTLREQGSDEQQAQWLPKAEAWKIIGTYAQTEMGHGSNVRGLELQARYDPKTKEFIFHSPTLTSSKWWPGSLGRTANHAVVVAQLMLPDKAGIYKSYGPHPFITPIRDMKTHKPLPGIVIGDIGPKYGYPAMDNGYMLFDQFRIPHSAFLSRYSKVDPETGAYTKPVNTAVVYGSLTYVRAKIIMHARLVLARAVTVAVRYLSIRRQFRDRDGNQEGAEMAVLDYPTVQIRILPLLATTFALHYSGRAMRELYEKTRRDISSGDFSALAEMHSTSSGLKSLCTTLAADGIEVCRRACGGHGFGGGTGLIALNNEYLSKPTVEGDNWMITQQTSAAIIKQVSTVIANPDAKFADFTSQNLQQFYKAQKYTDKGILLDILHNDKAIVDAFSKRVADVSFKAHKERIEKKRSWNSMLIQLHKLSRAHSQAMLVRHFHEALESDSTISSKLQPVMRDCFRLFALYTMDIEAREFYNAGGVTNEQLDALPDRIQELMAKIRPHAVNLVDAWRIPEYLLDSSLGRYDGKVYEALFHKAHRLNPLNRETFNPNFWEDEIVMGKNDSEAILAKL